MAKAWKKQSDKPAVIEAMKSEIKNGVPLGEVARSYGIAVSYLKKLVKDA